jgi:serine/threonine-protein kinase RIO1
MAVALRAPTNMMERVRMSAGLVDYDEIEAFIEDGWIEDVLVLVKTGKEANVYCCRACSGRAEKHSSP